jgi:hypothetical protein
MQKKKGGKKSKIEVKKELMSKLNDDEKNDLVSLEIELVQAEVEQVTLWFHGLHTLASKLKSKF